MANMTSVLNESNLSKRIEELKKEKGDPPWAERLVLSENFQATVIYQPPGHPNDRHYHIHDEWWVVLEGETQWEIEGAPEPVRAGVGDFVFAPKNHYHLITVLGDKPSIRVAIGVPGERHRHERD